MTVCYDLRFPELYRELAGRAPRVTVPAAFTLPPARTTGTSCSARAPSRTSVRARAGAQYGRHPQSGVDLRQELIVDPWGEVMAEVGDHEGVAVAESTSSTRRDCGGSYPRSVIESYSAPSAPVACAFTLSAKRRPSVPSTTLKISFLPGFR